MLLCFNNDISNRSTRSGNGYMSKCTCCECMYTYILQMDYVGLQLVPNSTVFALFDHWTHVFSIDYTGRIFQYYHGSAALGSGSNTWGAQLFSAPPNCIRVWWKIWHIVTVLDVAKVNEELEAAYLEVYAV